jgi:RNA polymerase sigma-70 factor (ECF subfamily)
MSTALNLCRKEHRRLARRAAPTQETSPPTRESIELREALAKLPLRQRQAVTLFYVGDLPIHSIAAAMSISEGAVKAHLFQGRKTLQRLLQVVDD